MVTLIASRIQEKVRKKETSFYRELLSGETGSYDVTIKREDKTVGTAKLSFVTLEEGGKHGRQESYLESHVSTRNTRQ